MTQVLKQSTAVDVLIGPFVDSGDGYTAEGGLSPAVKLSKNGQALAAKNDATTPVHDADGYYNCELDATDTNTVGTLVLSVVGSATSLPVRHEFQVVDAVVYDALYGDSGTFITAQDLGILVDSTLGTPTNQTTFPLQSGDVTANSEFVGSVVQIEDASTGEFHVSWITSSTASTDTVVINSAPNFTAVSGDLIRIYAQQHPQYALSTYGAATTSGQSTTQDKMLGYFQLALRNDAAINTDRATELGEINTNEGTGAGDYDNQTEALEQLQADIATVDTVADAVKVKTDQMNFGVANELDVNVESINATTVLGIGTTGNLWRGS